MTQQNGAACLVVQRRAGFRGALELTEAMRREGCSNIADVRIALLENDGKISVIKRQGT
jgi:uncharacterized membrane protein YcaP (DUF421 family)